MTKDSKILGPLPMPSDKEIQEAFAEWDEHLRLMEEKNKPKYKVGDKITDGKTILTILTISSDKYIVENNFEGYSILHFKNQDKWKILEEEDLDLKFKAGDRVFNKMTRKWVNIIEFDIETGLYIVRYDDGMQGRSLENELCEMEE